MPPRAPQGDGAAMFGTARILLVGIQREVSPPVVFGDQLLQRMGVVCAGRDEREFEPEGDTGVHVLPPLKRPERRGETHPPRLVRGEILRCERGTFYEHCRGRIRPLHRLFAGPRGEILEMPPGAEPAPAETAESTGETTGPAFRALFAGPGERRMVAWGGFKEALTPQIGHPERLRDSHQLPCDVQVYEVITPQSLDALATAALGDAAAASQLRPLTAEIAKQLGVPAPGRKVPAARPGLLGRGERFFRLRLAGDPTLAAERPAALALPDSAAAGGKAIPERYLKPWEFRLTREEAVYDINVVAAFQSSLANALRRLARWPGWRAELRKWQVLLSGKNFDEQLWGVRPPAGGVTHCAVREWAARTLALGGYEPRTMLLEWEIFWRRKGV